MSWHFNEHDGTSVIEDLSILLNDNSYMVICMEDENFSVTIEDEIKVGKTAMMIASDNTINLINTNYIKNIRLERKND